MNHMTQNPLLIIAVVCIFPSVVHGITEYYVKPTESTVVSCPGEPCHIFDHYLSNVDHYTWSNVAIIFLPGSHSMNQSLHIISSDSVQLISFHLSTSIQNLSVTIHCTRVANFQFNNVLNVTVDGLGFHNCGVPLSFFTHSFSITCLGTLCFYNVHNIRLTHVVVYNSFTFGIQVEYAFKQHNASNDYLLINSSSVKAGAMERAALYISAENRKALFVKVSDSILTSTKEGLSFLSSQTVAVINITNCLVIGNTICGLYFELYLASRNSSIHLLIQNSIIKNNVVGKDDTGAGLTIYMSERVERDPSIIIKNVSFFGNKNYAVGKTPAIVVLYKARSVVFIDCEFHESSGTSVRAFMSTFSLNGTNSFVNNSASEGGAVALLENSHLIINKNTETLFLNNSASGTGGAIFVYNSYPLFGALSVNDMIDRCSFTFYDIDPVNIILSFTNNTGKDGGDVIYGENSYACSFQQLSFLKIIAGITPHTKGIQLHFNPDGNSSYSLVSSDPLRVCICKSGRPECTDAFLNVTKYPGEAFNISTVVVGENFGTVTGAVYSKFLPLGKDRPAPRLEELQHFQRIMRLEGCTNLQYTVMSKNEKEILVLTAKDITTLYYGSKDEVDLLVGEYKIDGYPSRALLKYPVYVNITLLSCPLGFMLHRSQHRCVCHLQLDKHNITCNITNQTVHRSRFMWINASFVGNKTNGIILHKYCPFHYCKHEEMNVNLENPDDQCAFNHVGILCGGCQRGLSLMLGSSQCSHCSNIYLILLMPFATAGFALVFFLKCLNLTVSQGTINGLILYANIVKANEAVFFPPGDANMLTVFISWLNLDLGIETCFFNGLNGYWKTWLQFVFPIYIWIISATIITVSYYSSLAAKIFGNNSVPVLATLFLLSYAKLLRTIITTLTFTFLYNPDGSWKTVWSYDGNIPYFSSTHIPLFLVAIAFLIFILLPYTVVLLFKQYLQKYSNYKFLRWITRMKPFFDAYFGPYQDKHWHQVGTLLVIRVILLLTFAISQDPNNGLVVTNIAATLILLSRTVLGNVYKLRYLSMWENSFISNLIVLSLATLYIRSSGGNQAALVYTAVGTTFCQFIAIVFYHLQMRLRKILQQLHLKFKPNKTLYRRGSQNEALDQGQQLQVFRQPTQTIVALHELREPLLTD